MNFPSLPTAAETLAFAALADRGLAPDQIEALLATLRAAGLQLIDRQRELACRWVPVSEQPVPPEADTIIRTLTRTAGERSWTATYWLDGLQPPAWPGP